MPKIDTAAYDSNPGSLSRESEVLAIAPLCTYCIIYYELLNVVNETTIYSSVTAELERKVTYVFFLLTTKLNKDFFKEYELIDVDLSAYDH